MKLLKFKIIPKSSFASLTVANMIFGHFAKFLYLKQDTRLDAYLDSTSIVFSDFLPDGYVYKPTLPLDRFNVNEDNKKEFRKKEFIKIDDLQDSKLDRCQKINFFSQKQVIRNKINRNYFTTGDGDFAPYPIKEHEFKTNICLYVLFDETVFKVDEIKSILNEIGRSGFGKKSSIGKGQFEVVLDTNFSGFREVNSNYYITLSSVIFKKDEVQEAYYDVDTVFGKFYSQGTPFKKPVIFSTTSVQSVIYRNQSERYKTYVKFFLP